MRDIAHPLNSETREQIEERVLAEYEAARATRVVSERGKKGKTGKSGGKEDHESGLDRLASKLFNEEFWISELPGRSPDRD
jgi:hypothetical protein